VRPSFIVKPPPGFNVTAPEPLRELWSTLVIRLHAVRVAELIGVREFRVRETAITPPGPGEVQVQVEAVGICGSDLHAYSEGAVGDVTCNFPVVLGHEPAGVVVEVGAGVTGLARGDRAALEPAHFCYHCALCMKGRHNLCSKLRFLSTGGEPGFFRDRVNLPARNLVMLPPRVTTTEGTLVEPLAVVLHSLALGRPALGETAAVIGAGPIGLLTVAALRWAGVRRIWVVEPVAHRRALAASLGADATLDPETVDPVAGILGDTPEGVDLVVDCAAKSDTANQSLALASAGGRVVYTGIPSELRIPLDVHLWRRKELEVHQVRRSLHEGTAARDLLARQPGRLAEIITHQRPIEQIGRAFALVEGYEDGVGKLLVRLDPG
jgi:L-iditol 2-dehydrogenase